MLVAIKVLHTVVWCFFAGCIVAIPLAARIQQAVAALQLPERPPYAWFDPLGGWTSPIGFAAVGWAMMKIPQQRRV